MSQLAPLPFVLPILMAALLMAAQKLLPRWLIDGLAFVTALTVTILCGLLFLHCQSAPIVYWFGGWQPRQGVALGISFVIDPLGASLSCLAGLLVTAALVFSWRYFKEIGTLFTALMLTFLGAMAGFSLTGDLFNLFVFFELMSVAAYALTGYKIEEEQALEGALNFAITNSIGAFLTLIGISLLYARTGALNLAQIGNTLASEPMNGLVVMAFVLITAGFGVKAALFPFHFWLDDAHAVAPTPVCVLFSGVMVELGLYAIWRIYITVFSGVMAPHSGSVQVVFLGFGVVTALIGAVMCLGQRHLKRLLAFSTISHAGLFLIGVGLLNGRALSGTWLYILSHGLVKGALFLCAGILLNRFGSVDENVLCGKGRILRSVGAAYFVGALALTGLPPFGTYAGKSLMEEAATDAGRGWLNVFMLVISAMTGAAVLRAGGRIFLGWGETDNQDADTPGQEEKETQEDYNRAPAVMLLPTVALLAVALLLGFTHRYEPQAEAAALRALDRPAYAARVLYHRTVPTPAPEPPKELKLPGLLYGIGATLGALLLAAISLFRDRLPRRLKTLSRRILQPPMRALRNLHSGNVCDYVTWIVIGVVLLGGTLWLELS